MNFKKYIVCEDLQNEHSAWINPDIGVLRSRVGLVEVICTSGLVRLSNQTSHGARESR